MIVKIVDEPKARTRRKTFNYIREENILRHISKYAVSETKTGDKKAWEITYEVPFQQIERKEAYEFGFTNSGGFGVCRFPSSDFIKEKDRKWGSVEIKELRNLEFEIESIHQLWTIKAIHEYLGAVKVEKYWYTEQGSKSPASTFMGNTGIYWTCWFEPQRIRVPPSNYKGPLTSFFFEKPVAWKRPDLIISKGKYTSIVEAPKFDFLVECKNLAFDLWWKDGEVISEELLPYKTLFNPETLVVASLKSIPDWAKNNLRKEGFLVTDEFYPGGKGVSEFKKFME